jgi:choline-sulfatase
MTLTRRRFLGTLGTSVATAALTGCAGVPKRRERAPRNILFLMCDQHRFNAMGHSGNPHAVTPTLDGLAESGTVFERTYCQSPLCVPGRNSILLGRYAHSHGVISNQHLSSRELPSFPQVLRANAYRTACFGKLHIRRRDDLDWDLLDSGEGRRKEPLPAGSKGLGPVLKGGQPLGQPAPFREEDHLEWYAKERTIEFLEENRDVPWFVQCSFNKPHPPFQPPERHWNRIDRSKLSIPRYPENDLDDVNPTHWKMMESRQLVDLDDEEILDAFQGFYGNVAFCDELFGEVLDALDRLGLRENTLVVYTSDSGEMLYAHRLWTKFSLFDEAVRVPLVLSLPGAIPSGLRSDEPTEHIDLFPTFLDLAGIRIPDTVQGRSLLPFLRGQSASHREHARCEYGDTITMQAGRRYKFIDNGPETLPELYDHENDPREIENLATAPEHRERVEGLTRELREWRMRDVVVMPMQGRKRDD